jgi:hypothetical protein
VSSPPVYESSHRMTWLELRAAITDGAPLRRTLDDLAEDLILATQMLDR